MKEEMLEIQPLINECMNELHAIEIPVTHNCTFSKLRTRNKNTIARCVHSPYEELFCIELNYKMFKQGANLNVLKGLICHELLHTIPTLKKHNKEFADYSKKIQEEYGYEPMRIVRLEEVYENKKPIGRYICPECGMYTYIYEGDEVEQDWYCSEDGSKEKRVLI